MKLANEVAVVTGAGRGIGRAIAEMQAQEGAKVALVARTAAEVEAAADAIRAGGAGPRAPMPSTSSTARLWRKSCRVAICRWGKEPPSSAISAP